MIVCTNVRYCRCVDIVDVVVALDLGPKTWRCPKLCHLL